MRTTLNIDEDVLSAAKEIAKRERKSTGKFMSEVVRDALRKRATRASKRGRAREFHGFRPIPAGGEVVTNELVDQLRDELGI